MVSSPTGPLGDLSETRGEACDASQILSDRAENHKRVLFTKAALELPQYAGGFVANGVDFLAIPALERDDWVELGVPIGHRARIIKEHKALHPELW